MTQRVVQPLIASTRHRCQAVTRARGCRDTVKGHPYITNSVLRARNVGLKHTHTLFFFTLKNPRNRMRPSGHNYYCTSPPPPPPHTHNHHPPLDMSLVTLLTCSFSYMFTSLTFDLANQVTDPCTGFSCRCDLSTCAVCRHCDVNPRTAAPFCVVGE